MMVNGKVLCVVSPTPTSSNHFPTPTSYYEYDYTTNTFNESKCARRWIDTPHSMLRGANMVDLPNGQVLYADQGSTRYYVYTPDGTAPGFQENQQSQKFKNQAQEHSCS